MEWRSDRRPRRGLTSIGVVMGAVLVAVAPACSSSSPRSSSPGTTAPTATSTSSAAPPSTQTAPPCSEAAALEGWPLTRRAAQVIVVPALDGQLRPLDASIEAGVGGVLLLGNGTPADLATQISAGNQVAATPLLVMADEEGGGVQRLAGRVTNLPWARQLAATLTTAQVRAAALQLAHQMLALGVDVDLAPVLDLDGHPGPNAHDPDGLRSFSSDAATAASYGKAFLDGLREGGVMPVIKHFPGLGGASGNSDYGPAVTPPLGVLQAEGLVPFRSSIDGGAPAVMVANAVVPGLTTVPASVSPAAIQTLLRGELGFHGLVLTDSLSANALVDAGYTPTQAALAAIEAGADMVLFGSTLNAAQTLLLSPANVARETTDIVRAIVSAVTSGRLPTSRLDQAVADVLGAKHVSLCRPTAASR